MIGLIGRKLGMTQIPTEDGAMTAVTVIAAGPCTVLQGKTEEKDGYWALKIGFGEVGARKLVKPLLGEVVKVLGERETYPVAVIREFRVSPEEVERYAPGTELTVGEIFREGEIVDVVGRSKGRGFQGVMKRWGFSGGPRSHGAKRWHRRPGSIGQTTDPGRVWKGKKMPGHMGFRRVTVKHLKILRVIPEKHLLLLKGAVPGPAGGIVLVRKAHVRSGVDLAKLEARR